MPWLRWKFTDVSKERTTSIFRVEYKTSNKQVACLRACSPYPSTLMKDKDVSPKIPVNFYQTAGRHPQEDSALHRHHRENLKSHILGPCMHAIWSPTAPLAHCPHFISQNIG
jgi:hypothetical protein